MNKMIFALITIVAAVILFGVIIVTVASTMQLREAEARGCFPNPNAPADGGVAVNGSKGRCFQS